MIIKNHSRLCSKLITLFLPFVIGTFSTYRSFPWFHHIFVSRGFNPPNLNHHQDLSRWLTNHPVLSNAVGSRLLLTGRLPGIYYLFRSKPSTCMIFMHDIPEFSRLDFENCLYRKSKPDYIISVKADKLAEPIPKTRLRKFLSVFDNHFFKLSALISTELTSSEFYHQRANELIKSYAVANGFDQCSTHTIPSDISTIRYSYPRSKFVQLEFCMQSIQNAS